MERVTLCVLVVLAGCAGLGVDVSGPATPGEGGVGSGDAIAATYNATVVEIVDGDTVDVRYPNGSTDRVRLLGIDTPEVYGDNDPTEFEGVPDSADGRSCLRAAGDLASVALDERVSGERVRLVVDATADRRDRYGRLLAYLERDGTDVNRWLVAEGHARVYDTTFARSGVYYDLEAEAQDAGTGVWACRTPETGPSTDDGAFRIVEIHGDAAGNDNENLNDEYVVFENGGNSTLQLGGWTVSDEAEHTYTFPENTSLDPGDHVTLHTGSGENTADHLYWGRDSPVWNNDGDTVTVRTANGTVVTVRSYG